MNHQFLLISHHTNTEWGLLLCKVLNEYGELTTISRDKIHDNLSNSKYKIIFIDMGIKEISETYEFLSNFIKEMKNMSLNSNIVITTSAPTWRQAVDTFKAGAVDYLKQSMNESLLKEDIDRIINQINRINDQ